MATGLRNKEIIRSNQSSWSWERDLGISIHNTNEEGYFDNISLAGLVESAPKISYFIYPEPLLFPIRIGNRTFSLNNKLQHLGDTINESKRLLDLKDDWDDDGAIAINKDVYYRAIDTLIEYANNVYSMHGIAIKAPYISAGRDGSIDLEWNTPTATLLITILNTNEFPLHYYGDDGNNNTVIKGILNDTRISDDLIYWMRKL